jgi:hypothetical protein
VFFVSGALALIDILTINRVAFVLRILKNYKIAESGYIGGFPL